MTELDFVTARAFQRVVRLVSAKGIEADGSGRIFAMQHDMIPLATAHVAVGLHRLRSGGVHVAFMSRPCRVDPANSRRNAREINAAWAARESSIF